MNKRKPSKKAAPENWHRADIVAALRKAGWSLRRLSRHHGYRSPSTLTHALDRPWPKGERLVANAIGVAPAMIWPQRYANRHADDPLHKKYNASTGAGQKASAREVA